MESNFIKIIECYHIKSFGLITELQHFENGIPPNTTLINTETGISWIVKKRILSGRLLIAEAEIYFDCETELEHISHSYKSEKDRLREVDKELQRRKNGIYWYLLSPENKKQKLKPEIGRLLKIKQP